LLARAKQRTDDFAFIKSESLTHCYWRGLMIDSDYDERPRHLAEIPSVFSRVHQADADVGADENGEDNDCQSGSASTAPSDVSRDSSSPA